MDPEPPLFVFDGDCGFCRRWAAWVERHIPGVASFVPFQSIDLAPLSLRPGDVQTASYWVDEQGRTFRGNRSFAKALRRGHGWTRWAAIAIDLPALRLVTAAIYRVVVRNRHRLPAPTETRSD